VATRHRIAAVGSVLLYPREKSSTARKAASSAAQWLQGRGVKVSLPSFLMGEEGLDAGAQCVGLEPGDVGDGLDLVIALGGDGTLLSASRWVADSEVPVLGVNLGDLGFLSAYGAGELDAALEAAVAGALVWEARLRMKVEVRRAGVVQSSQTACNDAYITYRELPRFIELATSVAGDRMAEYRADGLIVSTPTGSTAYNLAAGGPIVDPGTDTLIVTPICPHSLTHRPVVVGAQSPITITYQGPLETSPASLSVDGQWNVPLEVGDEISIERAEPPLRLVPPRVSVFDVLAKKLGWSGPQRP